MDQNLQYVIEQRAQRTIHALQENQMKAVYVPTRDAALEMVRQEIKPGMLISSGGSMTLAQTGVISLLKSGDFHFLDRTDPALTPEQKARIERQAFEADVFLTSANAITEQGELFCVDGYGNRVAAMIFGPKKVLVVAGVNKIVPDIAHAVKRLEQTAAPANAVRLGCDTPCAKTGVCMHCKSPQRICCDYVVFAKQRIKDRIQVILVGEALGY